MDEEESVPRRSQNVNRPLMRRIGAAGWETTIVLPLLTGSQNFSRKFIKISVTLGLNILSFLRLKVLFKSKY